MNGRAFTDHRTKRVFAGVAIVTVVALLLPLTGCIRNAGNSSVEVPVMWVSLSDDGAMSGGVSPVGVAVQHTGSGNSFSVDLNASTSGSTGKSWDASSANAAAVAMLYSGQDPRGVQVQFTVDDAINGSSAGGALTVGVLAALRGEALRSGVTMTGTISPDGSIGSVDGVEAKIRGAANSGYTRVMVPTATTTLARPSKPSASGSAAASSASASAAASSNSGTGSGSSAVDVAALSTELGIEVLAVSTVGQAYEGFTGHDIAAPAAAAPTKSPRFATLIGGQIASAQNALETDVARALASGSITEEQAATGRARLAASRAQVDKGELDNAYASAIAALVVVNQQISASGASEMLKQSGSTAAAATQIQMARAQASRAESALATSSDTATTTSPVQQLASIASMTWLTKSVAVLRTISKELADSGGTVQSQVLEAAAVNAQYDVAVNRIFPDSFALAMALQPSPATDPTEMSSFIGGYSDLLSTAGSANQRYYESVLTSIAASPGLTFSQPGHLYGAVQQLQLLSFATTRTQTSESASAASASASASAASPSATATPAPTEEVAIDNYLARCSWDFAYFTASQYLVSAKQVYGLTGTGIGSLSIQATNSGALGIALESGTSTVDAFSAQIAQDGIDPDHGLWAAQTGNALAGVGEQTKHETSSAATGLQLVWDGAVETFMGNAAHNALGARQ